jgi:hypothetical protein
MKVAGFSFAGFCALALAAGKTSVAPEVVQAAGFCGAFLGAMVGRGRATKRDKEPGEGPFSELSAPPVEKPEHEIGNF